MADPAETPGPALAAPANPFSRPTAIFTCITVGCLLVAFIGLQSLNEGTWAQIMAAFGGLFGLFGAVGAIAGRRHAARFDEEQAAIDRGEAIADWLLPAAEWNRFVERCHAV